LCDKSNQKRSQQIGFFAAQAFALQSGQNLGCNLFAGLPFRFQTLYAKIFRVLFVFKGTQEGYAVCYALPLHGPPSFCPLSPEAYLLRKKEKGVSC
jgi:hypothetical protein